MTPLPALLLAGLAFGLLGGLQQSGTLGALPPWCWGALGLAALPPVAYHLVTRPAAHAPGSVSILPLALVTYVWFDLPAQVLKVQAITRISEPGDPADLTRLAWTEGLKIVLVSGIVIAWTLRQWRTR